jgi:hypothetical protein
MNPTRAQQVSFSIYFMFQIQDCFYNRSNFPFEISTGFVLVFVVLLATKMDMACLSSHLFVHTDRQTFRHALQTKNTTALPVISVSGSE